jgi:hypothetical protein
MANYNKSFNFRNGVQVDNDNFIVNANGLVGIGTTIPKDYLLNVYGDARVTGLVTATNANITNLSVGLATLTTLNVGITSLTSGIITATSGVVTYYGDGSKLSNLPTSQWIDVNPGAGVSSIYAAGNVGIATTLPTFNLQIGANPLVYTAGIGINSNGNVYSAGIITATSFSGFGSDISLLNASNITSGTLSTSFFPSSIQLSGIITASSFVGSGAGITAINADNITTGTLSTSRLPSNIVVSGIITANTFVGNLTGTATTATTLAPSGTVSVTSVNSGFTSTGIATVTEALYVVGYPAKVGVGTTTLPEADIEVNKTGISSIRVISTNNVATIGIGRSAEVRTGNTNTFYLYSTPTSLDIINSNTGNVNYYLDYGTAGLGTGAFHWIYGQDPSNPIMSLTYDGKLGIGVTNPTSDLYVVGTSYITGITTVDSNLSVSSNLTVSNNATVTNDLTVGGDITFSGSLTGNLGITTVSRLGIATDTLAGNSYELFVGGDPVFGPGVAVTTTGIRASGIIQASNLTATNANINDINSVGVITAVTFVGNLTGTATTSTNVVGGIATVGTLDVGGTSTLGITTTTVLNAQSLNVSGVTTSQGGFTSGIGVTNPVKITVSGNVLTFTVTGVGSTSLTLF